MHPDLGQGGAEKLVVEYAVSLQQRGHYVEIYTGYHDKNRCFKETIDGTLKVNTYGMWLPRTIMGLFSLPCALLKFMYVSINLMLDHKRGKFYDIIFVDQISCTIPLLKLSNCKILYYCHFPDLLLTSRTSLIKQLYRLPLDILEERTTAKADKVLVNSRFTSNIFKNTFKSIKNEPTILYPSIGYVDIQHNTKEKNKIILLSLNRYERKKNIMLAVDAFNIVLNKLDRSDRKDIELHIAGGYDARLKENVDYLKELKSLVSYYGIDNNVVFHTSISDDEKWKLLFGCTVLLYTPENEHFGIVPLEAGLARKPVIACNSGGPLETIIDNKTGFLREPDKEIWAEAIWSLIQNREEAARMGADGWNHVRRNFSNEVIISKLEKIMREMVM